MRCSSAFSRRSARATAIQAVGGKGCDGFALVLVN